MKAKLYSIRMQKRELDGNILEMRSTISSMRDERRTIESALEEKQNEIKLGERATEANKENSQLMALTEILKQKEAEIEDLKHRLEYPMKVWSVSMDDPSIPSMNLTAKDKFEASNVKEEGGLLQESTTQYVQKSRVREDRRENGVGFSERREMTGEGSQKMERSRGGKAIDNFEAGKMDISNDREELGIREEKSNANATAIVSIHGDEVLKTRNQDNGVEIVDGKVHESGEIGQQGKIDSQGSKDLENGANSRGGMKLEMRDHSQRGSLFRTRGRHGYLNRMKGQRSRLLAKNKKFERSGNFEENGDSDLRSGRVFKGGMENGRHEKLSNGEIEKMDRNGDRIVGENHVGDHHQQDGKSLEIKNGDRVGLKGSEEGKDTSNATAVELLKPQYLKDAENMSVKDENTHSDQKVNQNSTESMDRTIFREANETAGDAKQLKPKEVSQSKEKGSSVQQEKERRGEKVNDDSDKYGEAEDSNVADVEEAKRDILRESTSELEEGK